MSQFTLLKKLLQCAKQGTAQNAEKTDGTLTFWKCKRVKRWWKIWIKRHHRITATIPHVHIHDSGKFQIRLLSFSALKI